jgi:methylenetetrahydrofolate--tRNA-(uracil-5-)-methyltransferase
LGQSVSPPPATTALGALLAHITGGHLSADGEGAARSFQPMNVNFGLFPPVSIPRQPRGKGPRSGKSFERKRAMANRALADLDQWLARPSSVAAE